MSEASHPTQGGHTLGAPSSGWDCAEYRHPATAVKTVTTNAGIVYVCEQCSAHWFRKYGDEEIAR